MVLNLYRKCVVKRVQGKYYGVVSSCPIGNLVSANWGRVWAERPGKCRCRMLAKQIVAFVVFCLGIEKVVVDSERCLVKGMVVCADFGSRLPRGIKKMILDFSKVNEDASAAACILAHLRRFGRLLILLTPFIQYPRIVSAVSAQFHRFTVSHCPEFR